MRSRSICLTVFLLLGIFRTIDTYAQPDHTTGVETLGGARFTVISPHLLRLEYQAQRQFTDEPTLFAVNRQARYTRYRCTRTKERLVIDTGNWRLTYRNDGKPFHPGNLAVTCGPLTWRPGLRQKANLGGPIRTLDGVDGPVRLDDGVLSRDGWHLIDDSGKPLLTSDWVRERPAERGTDWYLFLYGSDYRAALKALTTISGPVPLPRRYTLGAWYSRYWPYSSEDYRQIVREYTQHGFPLDVLVLDMDWHRDGWTGWSWNRALLPDAEELMRWVRSEGLAATLNLHPADGVGPHEDAYPAFMQAMGEDPASRRTLPFDAADKRYMDALFTQVIAPLERDGVDFWWLDWQQYPNTRSIPSLTNLAWLNRCFYQHTAQNGLRGVSFSRWAGWGDHRHPIHFSGDASTSWRMLAFEVPFTAASGNAGCFFWSHDIGGHMGGRNEESYARWCQFGALTAALRSHSTRDPQMDRRPWSYPDWATRSMRISFHLRSRLFPYIYSSVWQSCRDSLPLNRPMYLEYPSESAAYRQPQQFLLGDHVLAAPIAEPGTGPRRTGVQAVWFPKGRWYNLFTGERYDGPDERAVTADIDEFPVYVRGGVPLPMQPYTPRMGASPIGTLVVRCYPAEDATARSTTLYEDDGLTTRYRQGECATTRLTLRRTGNVSRLCISPERGSYQGHPRQRTLTVEFGALRRARWASVNGRRTDVTFNAVERINRVTVNNHDIRKPIEIRLCADEIDPVVWRMTHAARRAGLSTSVSSIRPALLPQWLKTVQEPVTRRLLLAGLGLALVERYGTPNMTDSPTPGLLVSRTLRSGPARWRLYSMETGQTLATRSTDTASSVQVPSLSPDPAQDLDAEQAALQVNLTIERVPVTLELPLRINPADSKRNIAPQAQVSVSSQEVNPTPAGLTDRVVSGYPTSHQFEWSSRGQREGAWAQLDWPTEQRIDTVWLHDRINSVDQVTSGILQFSDGSQITVGELPNNGDGLRIRFTPKRVRWVRFTVTGTRAGTQNTGLAEIVVFRASPQHP